MTGNPGFTYYSAMRTNLALLFTAGTLVAAAGCSSSSNTVPTTGGIVITSAGLSQTSINVVEGGTVTWTNKDTKAHWFFSNVHPAHTGCPALNMTAALNSNGGAVTLVMPSTAQSCGYHEDIGGPGGAENTTAAFQGTIVVEPQTTGGGGGWVVGMAGTVVNTANFNNYEVATGANTSANLRSLYCVTGQSRWAEGWMVGDAGVAMHTPDGLNWVTEDAGTEQGLRGVAFADVLRGYAVGEAGTILTTMNGGQTWVASPTVTNATLNGVDIAADWEQGWAVGNGGVILTTVDGGATWHAVASGTTENLNGIRFAADTLHGFAVGNGGVVLASADGGKSWKSLGNAPDSLNALQITKDGQRIVAAGAGGLVWRSADTGATWSAVDTGTTVDLAAVGFGPDGEAGYAVGQNGVILNTTDGARSFVAAASPVTTDLTSVENYR